MIPDWQTNVVFFSGLLPTRHAALWDDLAGILDRAGVEYHLLPGTRDIWVRDFMPVQVTADNFVRFRYQPSYLCGYDDLITPDEVRGRIPDGARLHISGINLDGGNVVANGTKVILTEKVYRENSGDDRPALREKLATFFQAENIIIPKEPYDVIGHADGVVRFVNDDTVVVNDYRKIDPGYGEKLEGCLRRHELGVELLPYFCTNQVIDSIPSAVGNYINFLRVNGLVIVPAYGVRQDEVACRTLERLLPGTKIVPVPCEGLARQGGVLNCVSWTVYACQGRLWAETATSATSPRRTR